MSYHCRKRKNSSQDIKKIQLILQVVTYTFLFKKLVYKKLGLRWQKS